MAAERYPATPPGPSYRWWNLGIRLGIGVACVGMLGFLALVVVMIIPTTGNGRWVTIGMAVAWLMIIGGAALAVASGIKRGGAAFANAHTSDGTIIDIAKVTDSDNGSYHYRLTLMAEQTDGPPLLRHFAMDGTSDPEIGQIVPFRHTSFDPDALDDVETPTVVTQQSASSEVDDASSGRLASS